MNRVDIPERDISVEFPSCWEELTDLQFAFVMQNWLKVIDGKINLHELKIIVLYNFLGIKRSPFNNWKDKRLSREQLEDKFANIWQLTETLEWLFSYADTAESKTVELSYIEITNRIPELETAWEVPFVGPASGLLDITFAEYCTAWQHYENYINNRADAELDYLVATLYRPERDNYNLLKFTPAFDGNRREPFNPNLTQHYAELLTEVPFWQKYVILLWFLNCDRLIKEGELILAGKPISFAPIFRVPGNNTEEVETLDENDLGLTGLLFAVAESKLFGGPDQVNQTGYIDVLTALLYWKQQADKIKKS
jgi:hypothetical protein